LRAWRLGAIKSQRSEARGGSCGCEAWGFEARLTSMNNARRKKTADIAEKLGVGFVLGIVVQGIFLKEPSLYAYTLGLIVLAIAAFFLVLSIYLSTEE